MTKNLSLAAALLLGILSPAAAAEPQAPTRALANLATYVSDADYPAEAIRNNEQGTVAFVLDIGRNGKPTGCSIASSSGSPTLDATTCRIMMERPRFQPARDARGRPVPDQIRSRINWRLPEYPPSRSEAVLTLWATCLAGEAAKLATSDLSVDEIATRSFPACTALEPLVSREMGESALGPLRTQIIDANKEAIKRYRDALNSPPNSLAPKEP